MKYTVKYISNKCSQTDDLANKPHESVAKSLMTILKDHNEIKHPVIGVEGSWGSGKSQVINILQKLATEQSDSKKYLFHTYDIWSTQEDLTRRSFLDSLLNFATDEKNKCGFTESNVNSDNLAKLNATTTIHSTKTFPVVRLFYGVALMIPVSLFIITMIEDFFGYDNNAAWTYDQLRACFGISLFAITIVLFVKDLCAEFKTISKEDGCRDKSWCERLKTAISRILYLYKGKDIEKEDHETIIKDEPSVSRFRKIFNDLKDSIKGDAVLVIVFDNMDRLSDSSKLMSVWTLLHTFFAESDNEGKIWAIVPYDKQQLSIIMAEGQQQDKDLVSTEFLNKTFFTSIHIPEPIMTSWKKFLNDKLDEAFTPDIDSEERVAISLIFSRTKKGIIRPRDIIAFVNRLVTLYTQHHFEELPLSVLTLYSQLEQSFRNDPTDVILNHKGFEQFLPLFKSRTELSKQLAALYYNIETSNAMEVVLGGAITAFLTSDFETIEESKEAYKKLSSNSAFTDYIEEYFNNPELALEDLKPDNMFFLLEQGNISDNTKRRVYILVAESAETKHSAAFASYQPWMKWAFLNFNLQKTNQLIATILKLSEQSFSDYQNAVIELLLLRKERSELIVQPKSITASNVPDMLEFYDDLDEFDAIELYPQCKITVVCDKLLEYMKEGISNPQLFGANTEKTYGLLKMLAQNHYNFKLINDYIKKASTNLQSLDETNVKRIYKVFDIINTTITNVPPYTVYNLGFKQIPEYYAACIYMAKTGDANVLNNCFSNEYKRDVFIPILSRYVTLEEMFNMALKLNSEILYSMCRDLVVCGSVRLGNLSIHFTKTQEIVNILTEKLSDTFITLLDTKAETLTFKNSFAISKYWMDTITKNLVKSHPIYKRILDLWIDGLQSLNAEQWISNLNRSSNEYALVLRTLEDKELLLKAVYKTNEFFQAIESTLTDYVLYGKDFDIELYKLWKSQVRKSDLAILANNIKDKITAPNSIPFERFAVFIKLFISNSERFKDSKFADSFYDDYLSRYYRECQLESLIQLTIDENDKILSFINMCNDERKEKFKELLQSLYDRTNNETPAKAKINELIKKLNPQG